MHVIFLCYKFPRGETKMTLEPFPIFFLRWFLMKLPSFMGVVVGMLNVILLLFLVDHSDLNVSLETWVRFDFWTTLALIFVGAWCRMDGIGNKTFRISWKNGFFIWFAYTNGIILLGIFTFIVLGRVFPLEF